MNKTDKNINIILFLTGVIFLLMKLFGIISWSWIIVIIPFFINIFYAFVFLIVILFFIYIFNNRKK